MLKLALIGEDTTRSKSKYIHEKLTVCSYDLISVAPENLGVTVQLLKREYDGFNVTVPYKTTIMQYLDEADESARNAASCNTVVVTNGKLKGYSTDGEGLRLSLNRDISGSKILILGSGGAASSVAYSLYKAGANLTICNRTEQKARELIKKTGIFAKIIEKEMSFFEKYDIIINTTSVGMYDDQTPYVFNPRCAPQLVVDLIYHSTRFLCEAKCLGCQTLNGYGMLVWQAYLADLIYGGQADNAEAEQLILEAKI